MEDNTNLETLSSDDGSGAVYAVALIAVGVAGTLIVIRTKRYIEKRAVRKAQKAEKKDK